MKTYLTAFIFLLIASCNTVDPPTNNIQLELAFEDVSCTEAWLTLKTSNLQLPAEINIIKTDPDGNSVSQISILNTQDSLLYIDSLLPNKNYFFQVSSKAAAASNKLQVTTMDTTSHNFTWEIFSLGDALSAGSSVLYDIAIINENSIWAVGEIYTKDSYTYDSLGNWIDPYNAVYWNGDELELRRIYYYYNGSKLWNPIRTIFALNEKDIWFGTNIHWNGQVFEQPNTSALTGLLANKIWGTSSNDLYAVGNNGNIAWYNGEHWQRLESKTSLALVDVFGKGEDVYVGGVDASLARGVILKGNNSGFDIFINSNLVTEQTLFNPDLYGEMAAVWVDEKGALYAGGNLLFRYKFGKWDYVKTLQGNSIGGNPGAFYKGFIAGIRGRSSNDVWICGERNTLRHFNGISWVQVGKPYDPQSYVRWLSIEIRGNTTVAVGDEGNNAKVIIIKK